MGSETMELRCRGIMNISTNVRIKSVQKESITTPSQHKAGLLIHLEDPDIPELHHITVAQETDMSAGIQQAGVRALISRTIL